MTARRSLAGSRRARFLLRRLLNSVLLLLGISILSFIMLELAPGGYFDEMKLNPRISPETVDALRSRYGLDRPLPVRYASWLGSVARGQWGFSFAYGTPVAPLLWSRTWNTLVLGMSSLALAWLIAIPVGTLWAMTGRRLWDHVAGLTTATLLAFPEVLWALLFLLLAVKTGAFPVGGMRTMDGGELALHERWMDIARHMVLPVLALALTRLGVLVRHVRAAVAEVNDLPLVWALRAMGTPEHRIVLRHTLPLAANPLTTLLGLSIASLLSGSLIVEVVMGWPGLGPLLLEAILARDVYVVIGGVMCSALLLVAGSMISDLLLYFKDPRLAFD